MIRFDRRRLALLVAALFLGALCTRSFVHAQTETKGQRIYFSGHSFHYFMPPILADIAKKADIKDHTQVGLSAIGGSRVYQHWSAPQTAVAKDDDAATLPADIIKVQSTAAFPQAGKIIVQTANGDDVEVAYAGKTLLSFTGCTGGQGTLKAGAKISAPIRIKLRTADL